MDKELGYNSGLFKKVIDNEEALEALNRQYFEDTGSGIDFKDSILDGLLDNNVELLRALHEYIVSNGDILHLIGDVEFPDPENMAPKIEKPKKKGLTLKQGIFTLCYIVDRINDK